MVGLLGQELLLGCIQLLRVEVKGLEHAHGLKQNQKSFIMCGNLIEYFTISFTITKNYNKRQN